MFVKLLPLLVHSAAAIDFGLFSDLSPDSNPLAGNSALDITQEATDAGQAWTAGLGGASTEGGATNWDVEPTGTESDGFATSADAAPTSAQGTGDVATSTNEPGSSSESDNPAPSSPATTSAAEPTSTSNTKASTSPEESDDSSTSQGTKPASISDTQTTSSTSPRTTSPAQHTSTSSSDSVSTSESTKSTSSTSEQSSSSSTHTTPAAAHHASTPKTQTTSPATTSTKSVSQARSQPSSSISHSLVKASPNVSTKWVTSVVTDYVDHFSTVTAYDTRTVWKYKNSSSSSVFKSSSAGTRPSVATLSTAEFSATASSNSMRKSSSTETISDSQLTIASLGSLRARSILSSSLATSPAVPNGGSGVAVSLNVTSGSAPAAHCGTVVHQTETVTSIHTIYLPASELPSTASCGSCSARGSSSTTRIHATNPSTAPATASCQCDSLTESPCLGTSHSATPILIPLGNLSISIPTITIPAVINFSIPTGDLPVAIPGRGNGAPQTKPPIDEASCSNKMGSDEPHDQSTTRTQTILTTSNSNSESNASGNAGAVSTQVTSMDSIMRSSISENSTSTNVVESKATAPPMLSGTGASDSPQSQLSMGKITKTSGETGLAGSQALTPTGTAANEPHLGTQTSTNPTGSIGSQGLAAPTPTGSTGSPSPTSDAIIHLSSESTTGTDFAGSQGSAAPTPTSSDQTIQPNSTTADGSTSASQVSSAPEPTVSSSNSTTGSITSQTVALPGLRGSAGSDSSNSPATGATDTGSAFSGSGSSWSQALSATTDAGVGATESSSSEATTQARSPIDPSSTYAKTGSMHTTRSSSTPTFGSPIPNEYECNALGSDVRHLFCTRNSSTKPRPPALGYPALMLLFAIVSFAI